MSPLMYACKVGHMTLAQVLLSSGADPNFQDTRGWTVRSDTLITHTHIHDIPYC